MKHSELAELLTELYAARSRCGALHVRLATEGEIVMATDVSSAQHSLGDAIDRCEKKLAEFRKQEVENGRTA